MSNIKAQNPGTSEVQSPLIAGITEGLDKISKVLNMQIGKLENVKLTALPVDEREDRKNKIYEVPLENKLWLSTPPPVIKKNGSVITQVTDGFSIDYIGGSITFEGLTKPSDSDTITVSCSYIVAGSISLDELRADVLSASEKAERYKGSFATPEVLSKSVPNAENGDFAVVLNPTAVYIWVNDSWKDSRSVDGLSDYLTKSEATTLFNQKEGLIQKHGESVKSDNYYFGGRKTWINLDEKVRSTFLVGLNTAQNSVITVSDTILSALGKLQAQVSTASSRAFESGAGAPTKSTIGFVGQRYVNSSNGDEYLCTQAAHGNYIWIASPKKINGKTGTSITLSHTDVGALGKLETAADSYLFNGHEIDAFSQKNDVKIVSATIRLDSWTGSSGNWNQTAVCTDMIDANYESPWFYKTGVPKTDDTLQETFNAICTGSIKSLDNRVEISNVKEKPASDITIYFRRAK